jgi:predicted nucleotidyltransferase
MKKPDSKIQELNQRLQKACGKNLLSVVLYGSAAREDFHEQFSDVNLLIVVNEMQPASLAALAPVVQWWSHDEKLRPPLIMTLQELRESADVFAIELLDLKHSHQVLFGEDVVSAIEVPMNLHRVEVERELRTTLLRLRHHILLTRDNDAELRAVLARSISSVLTLFRHALIALGENPPHAKPKLLEHVAEVFQLEVRPVRTILQLRNDPALPMDVREHYYAYMNAIAHVAHELDVRQPKRHWQNKSGA